MILFWYNRKGSPTFAARKVAPCDTLASVHLLGVVRFHAPLPPLLEFVRNHHRACWGRQARYFHSYRNYKRRRCSRIDFPHRMGRCPWWVEFKYRFAFLTFGFCAGGVDTAGFGWGVVFVCDHSCYCRIYILMCAIYCKLQCGEADVCGEKRERWFADMELLSFAFCAWEVSSRNFCLLVST